MAWNRAWNTGTKYHSVKIETPEGTFDSKKEFRRWVVLKELQKSGEINGLERQKPFELIPAHREPDTVGPKGGIKKGKVIEKACSYIVDFCYYTRSGEFVVEDTKGVRTPEYVIKRKLMLDKYGIRIKEV